MTNFSYRGRDTEGRLRIGQRTASNADVLNNELIKEGITPIQILESSPQQSWLKFTIDFIKRGNLNSYDLAIFSKQMQLLHEAGVPIVEALKQLSSHSKLRSFSDALIGISEYIKKGESLSSALQHYPRLFNSLMVNIIQLGESSGHLSDAFSYLYEYLEFESKSRKQFQEAFRYPLFVLSSIVIAFAILNLYVIPTFAQTYSKLDFALPWQTRFLIATSNFFVNFRYFLLIALIVSTLYFFHYIHTQSGKLRWNKFLLHIPVIGSLFRRIILIRFCQIFSIIIKSGLPLNQGLQLVKKTIMNDFIVNQVSIAQDEIERGIPFTQALSKVELFTPLELQIISVGERSGKLGPSLSHIAKFHSQEIEFDLKKMNDMIGPILLGAISILVLIMALGVYLPIWNMVNLVH